MAFEGLLAKFGPSLLKELGPHLPRLIGGVLDRFRKDTTAMQDAISAEIASLSSVHAALTASVENHEDTLGKLQSQCAAIEAKLDRMQASQDALSRHAALQEEQLRTVRSLLLSLIVLMLLTLAASAGLYFLHR